MIASKMRSTGATRIDGYYDAEPPAQPDRSSAGVANIRFWPIADIGERPLSTAQNKSPAEAGPIAAAWD